MAEKKYLSLVGLENYDAKIKAEIDKRDNTVLTAAKGYADGLGSNYDPAGSAATALTDSKAYTDGKFNTASTGIEEAKTAAANAKSAADTAQAAADAAQADVDALEAYVGTIPEGATSTDVIGYVNEKTEGIASDTELQAIQGRLTTAEGEIDAIQADYLKGADKTALENADTALGGRIDSVEERLTGLSGAMHFKGVLGSVPTDVADYEAGDTIIVGEKEYVFDGTAFKEFGDASAEAGRIGALETWKGTIDTWKGVVDGEVDTLQADMTQAKADIDAAEADIVENAGKIATLEGASHTHANAEVLNGVTAAKVANWDAAFTDKHTHANKAVLDGIDATKVAAWDGALASANAYTDGKIAEFVEINETEINALFTA